MSNTIKTTHRGFEIEYVVDKDKWVCPDLSLENGQLRLLRIAIDRTLHNTRKAMAVECVTIGSFNKVSLGKIVEFAGYHSDWGYSRRHPGYDKNVDKIPQVWIMGEKRQKVDLADCVRPGPEADAFRTLCDVTRDEIVNLERRVREARVALPRLTESDIADLIKIAKDTEDKVDG